MSCISIHYIKTFHYIEKICISRIRFFSFSISDIEVVWLNILLKFMFLKKYIFIDLYILINTRIFNDLKKYNYIFASNMYSSIKFNCFSRYFVLSQIIVRTRFLLFRPFAFKLIIKQIITQQIMKNTFTSTLPRLHTS